MADSNPGNGAPFPKGPFLLKKGLSTLLCIACPTDHSPAEYTVQIVCQFCGSTANPLSYNTFYQHHHNPRLRVCGKPETGTPVPVLDNLPTTFDPAKYKGWEHIPISEVGGWAPCIVPTTAAPTPAALSPDDAKPAAFEKRKTNPALTGSDKPSKKHQAAPKQPKKSSSAASSAGPSASWLTQQKKKFSHCTVPDIEGWLEAHSAVDDGDIPRGKKALVEFTLKKYHELCGEVDWNLEQFQKCSF